VQGGIGSALELIIGWYEFGCANPRKVCQISVSHLLFSYLAVRDPILSQRTVSEAIPCCFIFYCSVITPLLELCILATHTLMDSTSIILSLPDEIIAEILSSAPTLSIVWLSSLSSALRKRFNGEGTLWHLLTLKIWKRATSGMFLSRIPDSKNLKRFFPPLIDS